MKHNSTARERVRINYIDVYKGICILFIIITHFLSSASQIGKIMLFPFWIDMAVPVFMIITGYLSSKKQKDTKLKKMYGYRMIISKWVRFIIPYIPIVFLEIFVAVSFHHSSLKSTVVGALMEGGFGPGSFYFFVMLQVVLIIPIITNIIWKYKGRGLVFLFIVNVLFEVVKNLINMSPWIYRLCSFRYIFVLAYGAFIYKEQHDDTAMKHKGIIMYLTGFLGVIYIILFEYMSFTPMIINQWTSTSVFAALFLVPIMHYLMRPNKIHNRLLELFGKASFDICTIQMLYYWLFAAAVYSVIKNPLLCLMINIFVCTGFGVAYYMIESKISNLVIDRIRNAGSTDDGN